jgi:hypothetical protein
VRRLTAYSVHAESEAERAEVEAKARAAGLTISQWFRRAAGLPLMPAGGRRPRRDSQSLTTNSPFDGEIAPDAAEAAEAAPCGAAENSRF